MKKTQIAIPKNSSRFMKVNCKECGEQQVVYSHVSTPVTCASCGNIIASPTGSKAKILGKISGNAE